MALHHILPFIYSSIQRRFYSYILLLVYSLYLRRFVYSLLLLRIYSLLAWFYYLEFKEPT